MIMIRRMAIVALTALVLTLPRDAQALMSLRPGDAPPPFILADISGKRLGSESLAGSVSVILF